MITDNLCVDVDVSRSLTGMNKLGRSGGKKGQKKATNSTGPQTNSSSERLPMLFERTLPNALQCMYDSTSHTLFCLEASIGVGINFLHRYPKRRLSLTG